jgi:hypothetical protein
LKKIPEQSIQNTSFFYLSILLIAALCIGIYLIVTTAIIAKDGVSFINYAGQLDIAPVKTMKNEFQHPGYPWLILIAHKITNFFHPNSSVLSWIYCGQAVTLLFRLLAITMLYFLGRQLVGAGMSFWAVLVLVFLPEPAKYGSDALSDWPHLFFLFAGLLFLTVGAMNYKWWLFGLAGLAAGAGYLVRPECAQIVVLGSLWCGLQIFRTQNTEGRLRALSAAFFLLATFVIIAAPYMKLKGAIFPKKDIGRFAAVSNQGGIYTAGSPVALPIQKASIFTPAKIVLAFGKFIEQTSQTLMWFFVPPLLIGVYKWLKSRKWYEPEKFFIIALIAVNILAMIWLYSKHGYMSGRHTLPLMAVLIIFVPAGIQELALWLEKKFLRKPGSFAVNNRSRQFCFCLIIVIGISICIPKLLKPIRMEEQGYRAAADWLRANTKISDVVAVPDKRINFYAERAGPVYEDGNIPAGAVYIVKEIKAGSVWQTSTEDSDKVEYRYIGKRKKQLSVAIYKNF